jgi:predicted phosphodiesterase
MVHDVFISHSAKNEETASAVCAALEAAGIRCWIAPRDIVPGVEWSEAIVNGISGSRVMVLILTSDANASRQVRREVQMACESGITVIPFRVEDVQPSTALRYYLTSVHYLDAVTPPLEQHLGPLADSILAQLAKSGPRRERGHDRTGDTQPNPKEPDGPKRNSPDEIGASPVVRPPPRPKPVSRFHNQRELPMPVDWQPPDADAVIIAHLSDLHLDEKNTHDTNWRLVETVLRDVIKPGLVCVTGDLVDTPTPNNFKEARKLLENLTQQMGKCKVRVCAGNHDRFLLGNKWWKWWDKRDLGKTFADHMRGMVVFADEPRAEELTSPSGSTVWKVGLVAIDSNQEADAFARGWVDPNHFDLIRQHTKRVDWDLTILLIHHHLLSVRALETSRRGSKWDLLNVLCLVNSGNLLEVLAENHVDIALHGHEHAHHFAKYGSCEEGRSTVRVVGAGTATGKGGRFPSFNVLILQQDRSVLLRRMEYDGHAWKLRDEFRLLAPAEIRRGWLMRSQAALGGGPIRHEPTSEVSKYVEFTRQRDIWVRWQFKNWVVRERFDHSIANSTGTLQDVRVRFIPPTGNAKEAEKIELRPDENPWVTDHTFRVIASVPTEFRGIPITIQLNYRWRGGAVLTSEEMPDDHRGLFRRNGYEWATVWSNGPSRVAELLVLLPAEFAPLEVPLLIVQDLEKDGQFGDEALALKKNVGIPQNGVFTLRVPYPRPDRMYVLAWKPIPAAPSPFFRLLEDFLAERGQEYLGILAKELATADLDLKGSVALYAKKHDKPELLRAGFRKMGRNAKNDEPAKSVPLVGGRSALAQAWWGATIICQRDPNNPTGVSVEGQSGSVPADQLGLMPSEDGMLVFSLTHVNFDERNALAKAILRIGFWQPTGLRLLSADNRNRLRSGIAVAIMKTLLGVEADLSDQDRKD